MEFIAGFLGIVFVFYFSFSFVAFFVAIISFLVDLFKGDVIKNLKINIIFNLNFIFSTYFAQYVAFAEKEPKLENIPIVFSHIENKDITTAYWRTPENKLVSSDKYDFIMNKDKVFLRKTEISPKYNWIGFYIQKEELALPSNNKNKEVE